jgi:ADP-heptose:LPS heptosyltransferase
MNKTPGNDATLQDLTQADFAAWGRVWSRTWQAFQNWPAGKFQGRRGIIYGASLSGQLVYSILRAMACEILAVVDSSPSKIGTMFIDNRPILSPDNVDWQNSSAGFVLIASTSSEATRRIKERLAPVCHAEIIAFSDVTAIAPPRVPLPPLHSYTEWLRHANALPSDMAWMRDAVAGLDEQPVFDVTMVCSGETLPSSVCTTLDSLKDQAYGKWRAWRVESDGIRGDKRVLLGSGPIISAGMATTTTWALSLDAGARLAPEAFFELATEAAVFPLARSIAFSADRSSAEKVSERRFDPNERVVAMRTDGDGAQRADAVAQPDRILPKALVTLPGIGAELPMAGKNDVTLTPILNKAPLRLIDRKAITRILLIKLDHIGDAVLNIPVMRRIREWFPEADITLLAATWNEQFLREQLETPGVVQRVLTFNFFREVSQGGHRPLACSEIDELANRLAPFHFDLAIDLRREADARAVLKAVPARWKIAFGEEDPFSLLGLNSATNRVGVDGSVPITRQMHLLLDAYLRPDDSLLSSTVLHQNCRDEEPGDAEPTQWVIGFNPGCGDRLRIWPAQYYAETADLLSERLDARTIWFGAPREEPIISTFLRTMKYRDQAVSRVGQLDLPGFAREVRRCHLFIGNTTGSTHIAAASGVPTLNIFSGQVSPFEWAPIGPAPFVLRVKTACAPCHRLGGECEFGRRCLTAITPEAAVRAACQILLGIHGSLVYRPQSSSSTRSKC